jgi:uncharacterized protein (DUF1697 family)
MELYVAFLRGMNLGARRIKNEQLRVRFEELGFGEVATFRASGNVVFSATSSDQGPLAARIEDGLSESLGYQVAVFLRSAAEVSAIAGHLPFNPDLIAAAAGKLQVMMLRQAPSVGARAAVLAMATAEDRLAISGRELYWLPSGGIRDSPLETRAIDAALGPATMRTMGTIERIAAKHCADLPAP